jgi:hypothetical protein
MSTNIDLHVEAGEDLSSRQYHAVNVSGTLAASAEAAVGILQNKPNASGKDGSARVFGKSFYRAGGAVTANQPLSITTSGWFSVADSGDQTVGKAISAVASGGVGEGVFNIAAVGYLGT